MKININNQTKIKARHVGNYSKPPRFYLRREIILISLFSKNYRLL